MSVQVTLTFANVDDMLAHFAGKPVTHIKSAPTVDLPAVVNKEEVKAPQSKKATSAATQVVDAPTQPIAEADAGVGAQEKTAAASIPTAEPAEAEPQASTAATDPAVDYKQAAEAVTKLSRTKGRDAAVAVLKQFKADKLPDVKPDDFAAVVKACNDAMGV